MLIVHLALGGCIKAPPVPYGLTTDTGGHIAYILAAATAQAARSDVTRVEIVTRRFERPDLGNAHAQARERWTDKIGFVRLSGASVDYLAKERLADDIPALTSNFLAYIDGLPCRPAAIHAHFADAAEIALAARARFGIPVLYTPHSLAAEKGALEGTRATVGETLAQRIERERRALVEVDAIVVSSRDEAERQVPFYGDGLAGRVETVVPGLSMDVDAGDENAARALIAPFLTEPERPMILAVARPVRKKNLIGLVRAFATNRNLVERANLVILAGQWDRLDDDAEASAVIAELREAKRAFGLDGRMALPPAHGHHDVAALYRVTARGGGVFVNPAFFEPFGLTLLEAAAAGLPVVATNRGGPRDILRQLRNGLAVPPDDPVALGEAIGALLGDAALHQRCSREGRQRVRRMSWGSWAERVVARIVRLNAPVPAMPRRGGPVLFSDLDGTLTGDRRGIAHLRDRLEDTDIALVVATGRSLSEARRVHAEWDLPEPAAWITSVGSEIYRPDGGGLLAFDGGYAALIGAGWNADAVERVAKGIPGLREQEAIEQRRWKRSYIGDAVAAAALEAALAASGVPARVIHSHATLIDVLPMGAGKAAAARYVARLYGTSLDACPAAGDSGNDVDLLTDACVGIIPSNGSEEISALRGAGFFRARADHAMGVAEGLDAWLRAEGRYGPFDLASRSVAAE